jgi:Fe2+ transport system protein B
MPVQCAFDSRRARLTLLGCTFNSDTFPMILVGNKEDLGDQREITADERKNIGKTLKIKTMETSAKNGTNVDTCFYDLVREIRCVLVCNCRINELFCTCHWLVVACISVAC